MGNRLNRLAGNIGRKLIRYAKRDGNLVRYAKKEWKIVFPRKDEMQDAILENVLDVVSVFSLAGHSGFSAGYAIGIIEKILRFEPLGPITGADEEWTEISDFSDVPLFQNKRLSSIFKDGKDAQAYDIDGVIYREPSGACYTKGGARNYITFPYVQPKTVYIDVDEDGKEIPSLETECAQAVREISTLKALSSKNRDILIWAANLLEKIS